MRLFDCTLRDGANVVGLGFNEKLTESMLRGLIGCGITEIEFGNAHGIGCNEPGSPLTDEEYIAAAKPYLKKARLGMFLQSGKAAREVVRLAAAGGLAFLRVGCIAGKAKEAVEAVRMVREAGLECRYSMMRVYVLTPEAAAEEALFLEQSGVQEITLMDSAGTMIPDEVAEYIQCIKKKTSIPIGFHGHNNLGLAVGNALAAMKAGADSIDTGLMGMARSAGNCATELIAAALQRLGLNEQIDVFSLLAYIDSELAPAMEQYGYRSAVAPKDLVYGLSGCHSNVAARIEAVAEEMGVSPYRLVMEVSAQDKISPSEQLIRNTAEKIRCR